MHTEILLIRLGGTTALDVLAGGGDSIRFQHAALERVGAKVLHSFFVTGSYDQVLIVEVADDVAGQAVALSLNAAGFYTETLRAVSQEALEAVQVVFADTNELGAQPTAES